MDEYEDHNNERIGTDQWRPSDSEQIGLSISRSEYAIQQKSLFSRWLSALRRDRWPGGTRFGDLDLERDKWTKKFSGQYLIELKRLSN